VEIVTSGADAAARSNAEEMPSQASGRRSVFDRFATHSSQWVSKDWFFTICVLAVVLWVPTLWVLPSVDTWQLVINTVTAIITFLLVALLQNTQPCADKAMQQKLNALADALWDLMGELGDEHPELRRHRRELADAVGLKQRETRI
jgi:low affinity Fe/Cu permease